MSIEFKLPELGENITTGDVVKVLVREGDVIAANDGVIELETDKAVVEIPCPHAGKISKLQVAKGQTIKVGQPVLSIEAEAEADRAKPQAPVAPAKPQAAVVPAKPQAAVAPAKSPHPGPIPKGEGTERLETVPAGPETRRLARELGIDLSRVQGSGKGGRITVEDVRAAAASPQAAEEQPTAREPVVPPGELSEDAYGPVRRERMSRIRRTIAAQMVKSATTIPHVTNFDDADVTNLEHMRKTLSPIDPSSTVKLTAMPLVIRAVALALRRHPLLNASFDEEKEEIVYKQYVNLGVAVDTPRGLVVPVIRNVDQLDVLQIARELAQLASRARSAEFSVEELRGGTFTISNLGAVGGTYSTPIINHPEVAILLLGRSRWLPSVHEWKIEGRLMMPLSLSYDHRVVDGATAGRFLNEVIDYLQSPAKLLLTK
jgi:pyruvate dehydrogenase E2 component (dihydrolipoamide acetyltransferase)